VTGGTPGQETPQGTEPKGGAGGMLRQGFWNYAVDRWAPKSPTRRLAFEMAILIGFFAVLAALLKLASS
jgi:hypothetical protein